VTADRYGPAQLARLLGVTEPTAEQAAVISATPGPMAVIAGAGSGKSETMAARLVWLVANGMARPERILGLTFTRKAAAELSQRVRTRLDALRRAGLNGPAASQDGAAGQGGAAAGPGPGGGRGRPDLGRGAVPPAWPGQDLIGPGGQLALDFGPDPAPSAGPPASPPPGEAPFGDPVVSTYHAYAGRLVGDHALREALEPSLRLITPAVAWQLAARVVAAYDGPMDAVHWSPSAVTAAVLDLAGDLAEHLRGAADVRSAGGWLAARYAELARPTALARKIVDCQRTREQLLPLVAAYAAAKKAREVIDYGDQMALAARIAQRHPEVGAGERSRYQIVLLDEYQDTSHAQLVLLRSLFGGGHPVTAVGDPCQSIYGWRGASAGNLRRFTTDFPSRGGGPAPVRLLSTSFRNTGRVLDAAALIQAPLRAEAAEVPRLIAPPGRAGRGLVTCALLGTAQDEADWIARQIGELLALPPGQAPDGRPWPDSRADRLHPADIAVLCRKRSQFPVLRATLEAAGIPVEVVGLGGLLTVPEVQDIVATLRVMHDPGAADALARLLTGPRWRIGPRDLVALGHRARFLTRFPAGPPGPGAGEPAPVANPDALAQAVTDFTAEAGSLIEALDDLGEPGAFSAAGYERLGALAGELRSLRGHASRSLPELVAEVERMLGLDIEVASRPGRDTATARADLDAFADAAAAFGGDQEEPTLGAFLAYLAAADEQEFGLEAGQVGAGDSVKLATVHAAKGLQWAAVLLPGLADGEKSHLFPSRPRVTTRWTENPRLLPFGLRGDTADLPALSGLDAGALAEFKDACEDRALAEERRLAYVGATRAAFWLGCSGYWWGSSSSPLGPSMFLAEVRQACEAGAGPVGPWAEPPEEDAENPVLAEPDSADWPAPPEGERYERARAAAGLVEQAIAARRRAAKARAGGGGGSGGAGGGGAGGAEADEEGLGELAADPELSEEDRALVAAWARDTTLLLAEREQRRGDQPSHVVLPSHLPVSALVTMARDPDELARQVRRPMPRPPAPAASRGTAFHRWLEQRFGPSPLIDPGDLPGAADDEAEDGDGPVTAAGQELAGLQQAFESGEWASRWPAEVEVPFETLIGDRLVRGRIDAVFSDSPDGGWDVVDWKTGRPPQAGEEQRVVAVQLAAYRLAWAGLTGVDVSEVRAAFYYVRHDVTVRPADLLDRDGLTALIEGVPLAT
jgi:DNA helicase-2/ATP-dependent DNA helicase PcrA